MIWDNISKGVLIPDKPTGTSVLAGKEGDLRASCHQMSPRTIS